MTRLPCFLLSYAFIPQQKSFSDTVADKKKKKSCFFGKVSLWRVKFAHCLLTDRASTRCQGYSRGIVRTRAEVSISLCLRGAVRGAYQNGCLSAADLKWGYDGDISGHVCENTITSMSRLNHSPLCYD